MAAVAGAPIAPLAAAPQAVISPQKQRALDEREAQAAVQAETDAPVPAEAIADDLADQALGELELERPDDSDTADTDAPAADGDTADEDGDADHADADDAPQRRQGNELAMARKQRTGVVVSDRMNKTVVVGVERTVVHPLYKKVLRRRKQYKAHDETNVCALGDQVLIEECRPLSRQKQWRVVEILQRHEVADVQPRDIQAPALIQDEPAAAPEPEASAAAEAPETGPPRPRARTLLPARLPSTRPLPTRPLPTSPRRAGDA